MTEPLQPGQHLSPDQFSAFAENVLPEHERLAALTHLSACADCRQIVFLAQQADPAPVVVPASGTPRRSWFTLPQIFGAATAALACSLILALIIHLRPEQNSAKTTVTTAQLQPTTPIAPPSPTPTTPEQKSTSLAPAVRSYVYDQHQAPILVPPPAQVQMPPTPQPTDKMVAGKATGITSEAKMAAPKVRDKQSFADDPARSASTYAAPAPQKAPAAVGGMMAMPPAASPAQFDALTRTSRVHSANDAPIQTAAAPAANFEANAATDTSTINAASIENLPANNRNATNYAALAKGAEQTLNLPSKKPAASVLNTAGHTLALDTDGALFLSKDHGKHWTAVATQWSGKAVQLSFAPTPARLYFAQPAQNQAQSQIGTSNTESAATGVPQQQAPIPTAGFQLTTATGAVWVSADGITWHPR